MRLLTHNTLKNPAKDAPTGYPLLIEVEAMEMRECEFSVAFIRNMLPSLEWNGVLYAAKSVGIEGFPAVFDMALLADEEFCRAAHNLLLCIHIEKGILICPETGRRFVIEKGIPNMIIPEADC